MKDDVHFVSRDKFTEQDHFIIEAAEQLGFEPMIDAETPTFVVSDEDLVAFAKNVGAAAIEQALAKLVTK